MSYQNDAAIVRDLAKRYMDIAQSDTNLEKTELYRRVNALKPIRPVVLIDELPWHEMNIDDQLTLRCESDFAREWEDHLRKCLFRHQHFPADAAYPPYISVPKIIHSTGVGLTVNDEVIAKDENNHIISHKYNDLLADEANLDLLHPPVITYDKEASEKRLEDAAALLGDSIPVKLNGFTFSWTPWDDVSRYRGVTPLLMDLIERPEYMHRIMEKKLEIAESTITQYEKLGLLAAPSYHVHCTAGLADELTEGLAEDSPITAKNIWGRGAAQIFGSVSADMLEAFDIAYMKRFMDKFGLVYYGCCEPLHDKIHIVEQIPHLRKISITPWAKVDPAAEAIGGRYVFASKPNPAFVAEDTFDPERVRQEILQVLNACQKNGTTCEFVLKDISTCGYRPQNIFDWEKTVMETVLGF